ncbi:hypothetical protein GCM10023199_33210 [Actinomycetospora chibensis]
MRRLGERVAVQPPELGLGADERRHGGRELLDREGPGRQVAGGHGVTVVQPGAGVNAGPSASGRRRVTVLPDAMDRAAVCDRPHRCLSLKA